MELAERVSALEANEKTLFKRVDTADRRIEETDKKVDGIHELSKSVSLLAQAMTNVDKKVDGIDERLETMEKAPVEDARYYKRTIIAVIISGALGSIITAIIALIVK